MNPLKIYELLQANKGSCIKTRRAILRLRGWTPEDWYRAWQTTDLGSMFNRALRMWRGDPYIE